MKRFLLILAALVLSVSFAPLANAQAPTRICILSGTSCADVSTTNPFPISIGSVTASSANNADNVIPVATGLLGVSSYNYCFDGLNWDRCQPYVNGTQDALSTQIVTQAVVPSADAAAGLTSAQITAAGSLVAKVTAGNLYGLELSQTAAANFIMVFDATAVPADGAVSPKKCFALPATATNFAIQWPTPVRFTTGIVMVLSSTGCATKTVANAAFIGVNYR
jgi:hypothetical protein